MQMNSLNDFMTYCKENVPVKTLAVIKAEDDHTLGAVAAVRKEGVINAVLIGNAEKIKSLLAQIGEDSADYTIVDEDDYEAATKVAISMVHAGAVDFLMKGTVETKALMSLIVAKDAGMRTDRIMSKVDFMEIPGYHKLVAFTDSALNTKPDLAKKKQIILNALDVCYSLGIAEPKVAVLAAAETVNPKLQESTDAAALQEMYENGEFPPCMVAGPISIDLTLDKEAVRIKNYTNPVGGDADLMVCPDLVSGNLMGKGMLLCGAHAAGIIVGAKVPVVLMSRSAAVEEKINSIVLGAIASVKGE